MSREIVFYKKSTGECPTEEFLDSLPKKLLIKILSVFKLVENEEIISKRFFKKLTGTSLFEIRVMWESNIYRFPCFFEKNNIVILTHGFQKKTMKTPKKELDKAEKYYNDYIRRQK